MSNQTKLYNYKDDPGFRTSQQALHNRIKDWPQEWGNFLKFQIYGTFKPFVEDTSIDSLGVKIFAYTPNNASRGRFGLHDAEITVLGRTVEGLCDAVDRIDKLLSLWTMVDWGNPTLGWSSTVTHGFTPRLIGFCYVDTYHTSEIDSASRRLVAIPEAARRQVEHALRWVQRPQESSQELYDKNILQIYSNYWNAFECLVRAVCLIHPPAKLSKSDKRDQINAYLSSKSVVTVEDITYCYQNFVNPGIVGDATHALRCWFPDKADHLIETCFRLEDRNNRLYDIRNAINHGTIDTHDPRELIRVEVRWERLRMLVVCMFGSFLGFYVPLSTLDK